MSYCYGCNQQFKRIKTHFEYNEKCRKNHYDYIANMDINKKIKDTSPVNEDNNNNNISHNETTLKEENVSHSKKRKSKTIAQQKINTYKEKKIKIIILQKIIMNH